MNEYFLDMVKIAIGVYADKTSVKMATCDLARRAMQCYNAAVLAKMDSYSEQGGYCETMAYIDSNGRKITAKEKLEVAADSAAAFVEDFFKGE